MNKELIAFLNRQVANYGVLYVKLHNYHWFVKGRYFYQLHAKFEELYDEVTGHFDELAERILMLGGKPVASLKEFLSLATIKEASDIETAEAMVASVLADFEQLNKEFFEGMELAGSEGDDVTADLFTKIQASLQKHIWMMKMLLA